MTILSNAGISSLNLPEVREELPEVELPEVELPEVELPKVEIPEVEQYRMWSRQENVKSPLSWVPGQPRFHNLSTFT